MNVGDLIYRLSQFPDDAPVLLAMQPGYPLQHFVGEDAVVEVGGTVFIGESEWGTNDYLSEGVADALGW